MVTLKILYRTEHVEVRCENINWSFDLSFWLDQEQLDGVSSELKALQAEFEDAVSAHAKDNKSLCERVKQLSQDRESLSKEVSWDIHTCSCMSTPYLFIFLLFH